MRFVSTTNILFSDKIIQTMRFDPPDRIYDEDEKTFQHLEITFRIILICAIGCAII